MDTRRSHPAPKNPPSQSGRAGRDPAERKARHAVSRSTGGGAAPGGADGTAQSADWLAERLNPVPTGSAAGVPISSPAGQEADTGDAVESRRGSQY